MSCSIVLGWTSFTCYGSSGKETYSGTSSLSSHTLFIHLVAGHVHHSQLMKKLSQTDIISVETTSSESSFGMYLYKETNSLILSH